MNPADMTPEQHAEWQDYLLAKSPKSHEDDRPTSFMDECCVDCAHCGNHVHSATHFCDAGCINLCGNCSALMLGVMHQLLTDEDGGYRNVEEWDEWDGPDKRIVHRVCCIDHTVDVDENELAVLQAMQESTREAALFVA